MARALPELMEMVIFWDLINRYKKGMPFTAEQYLVDLQRTKPSLARTLERKSREVRSYDLLDAVFQNLVAQDRLDKAISSEYAVKYYRVLPGFSLPEILSKMV